jgi:hypothetical protein
MRPHTLEAKKVTRRKHNKATDSAGVARGTKGLVVGLHSHAMQDATDAAKIATAREEGRIFLECDIGGPQYLN